MSPEKIEVDFRIFEHGSREYKEAIKLRQEVLRRPLGLTYSKSELDSEADQLHFVGFIDSVSVACAVLQWIAPNIAKMRQVAVKADMQRRGLGRRLIEKFEEEAKQRGAHKIILHARQTAIAFYTNLGYEVIGDSFEEIGIPHQQMYKLLTDGNPSNQSESQQ